jgi:hypothetical protein
VTIFIWEDLLQRFLEVKLIDINAKKSNFANKNMGLKFNTELLFMIIDEYPILRWKSRSIYINFEGINTEL